MGKLRYSDNLNGEAPRMFWFLEHVFISLSKL